MKYYIIAGEASGDLHASNLMRELLARDPACDIRFWGGDAMAAAGGMQVRHYRDTAVMGVTEVFSQIRKILKNLAFCREDLLAWRPDAVILVDCPGFNLKVARFARQHGFKVFWYIAPKVWAHGARRVKRLRRDVDVLYCIFPFEPEWFRQWGIEARYFGNPLLDSIGQWHFRPLEEGGAPAPGKVLPLRIALLPGSRAAELKFLMPRFMALERLLAADSRFASCRLTVAGAPSMPPEAYRKYIPAGSRLEVISGRTYDVLAASRAAVICSGTASLETALIGTPQVVCYGFSRLTWWIARLVVKVRFVSLVNLVLNRPLCPELLQSEASPEAIFRELEGLLQEGETLLRMRSGYEELKEMLGGAGASARIAEDMYDEMARV